MEYDIFHDFNEDTTAAEHRNGAEHRVAVNPEDTSDAAGQLLRDQHALDLRLRVSSRRESRLEGRHQGAKPNRVPCTRALATQ